MDTQIIKAIEEGKSLKANELLEKVLYTKADGILKEKKKQLVAKTWGKSRPSNLTESDSKGILNASKRKAFREKMLQLKKVK